MGSTFRLSFTRSLVAGLSAVLAGGTVLPAAAQMAPPANVVPPAPTPAAPPAAPEALPAPPSAAAPQIKVPPAMMQGPASVADLAAGLLDAVVNISTSQNVKSDAQDATAEVKEHGQSSAGLVKESARG